jgi:predicted oxidoreductase (fatty acid repression mutant protein)
VATKGMATKKKTKKEISLDQLARMMDRGFDEVLKVTARKKDVDAQFATINERLDTIETMLFLDHKSRIEKLEDQVRQLQNDFRELLGLKNK